MVDIIVHTAADVAATYLVVNVEFWFRADGTADWVVFDSLQQVVSVPPECLPGFSPNICATLVVPVAKGEHTPGKHAGRPCNGGSNLDSSCSEHHTS